MIHLIVGNTGAGKTTLANKLKKELNGIIFSIDKWNKNLFLEDLTENDGVEWYLERIDRSETVIMDLILQLEAISVDSILDLGLAKIDHRKKFIEFANKNNFEFKIHYLDISKSERFKRIQNRNFNRGETYEFDVSEEDFEFMEDWFEPLTDNELTNALIIKE